MKSSRQWIVYTGIRIGLFAVLLAVLLIVGVNPFVAAIGAAVIGLCVSYIFFRGPRDAVARSIVDIRAAKDRDADSDAENDILDTFEQRNRLE